MNLAKEVELLKRQLAALQQREKAYILWHHLAEPKEWAIECAIARGIYNPETQEPVFILSQMPFKQRLPSAG